MEGCARGQGTWLGVMWGVLRPHRRGGFSTPRPSVDDPHPELLTILCPGWCLGRSSSSRGLVGIIQDVESCEGPIGRQSHLALPQPGSSELMTSWLRPAPTVLACSPSLPRSGPQLPWPLKRLNEPRSRGLCYCLWGGPEPLVATRPGPDVSGINRPPRLSNLWSAAGPG